MFVFFLFQISKLRLREDKEFGWHSTVMLKQMGSKSGSIRESREEKGGCPATESGSLPPENEDLEAPGSRLKGVVIIVTYS